jgi:hypothetical protein
MDFQWQIPTAEDSGPGNLQEVPAEVASSCLEELSVCPCKGSSKIWLYSQFFSGFPWHHFTPWKHISLRNDQMHHKVAEEKMFKTELLFSLNCYVQNRIKDALNHVKLWQMWRYNSKRMINNVVNYLEVTGLLFCIVERSKAWRYGYIMYVRLFIGCWIAAVSRSVSLKIH